MLLADVGGESQFAEVYVPLVEIVGDQVGSVGVRGIVCTEPEASLRCMGRM